MNQYIPLLMLFVIGIALSGGFVLLSYFVGVKKPTAEKMTPYECGVDPAIGSPRERMSVKFYLVAMLFILFDIEVVFLYPWATLFREFKYNGFGTLMFMEMLFFISILGMGLVYVIQRKGLEWE